MTNSFYDVCWCQLESIIWKDIKCYKSTGNMIWKCISFFLGHSFVEHFCVLLFVALLLRLRQVASLVKLEYEEAATIRIIVTRACAWGIMLFHGSPTEMILLQTFCSSCEYKRCIPQIQKNPHSLWQDLKNSAN